MAPSRARAKQYWGSTITLVPYEYDVLPEPLQASAAAPAQQTSQAPRATTYAIDTLLLLRQSPFAKPPHCGVPVQLPKGLQRDAGDPHFWRPRQAARVYGQVQARKKR